MPSGAPNQGDGSKAGDRHGVTLCPCNTPTKRYAGLGPCPHGPNSPAAGRLTSFRCRSHWPVRERVPEAAVRIRRPGWGAVVSMLGLSGSFLGGGVRRRLGLGRRRGGFVLHRAVGPRFCLPSRDRSIAGLRVCRGPDPAPAAPRCHAGRGAAGRAGTDANSLARATMPAPLEPPLTAICVAAESPAPPIPGQPRAQPREQFVHPLQQRARRGQRRRQGDRDPRRGAVGAHGRATVARRRAGARAHRGVVGAGLAVAEGREQRTQLTAAAAVLAAGDEARKRSRPSARTRLIFVWLKPVNSPIST